MAWASLKGTPFFPRGSPGRRYPGPHGLGLIEGGPQKGVRSVSTTCIPGRMAWASLKGVCEFISQPLELVYPGPHGLGLIEGMICGCVWVPKPCGIPGRMAWASLKAASGGSKLVPQPRIPGRMAWASLKGLIPRGHGPCEIEYPGPHGLGLIEGWRCSRQGRFNGRIPGRMAWASLKES